MAGQVHRPPPRIRMAAPCAGAAARRVDQHAVELALLALHPRVALAVEQPRLDIVDAGAPQPFLGARQPRLGHLAGDHPPLARHARRQGQRLAAGTGAEIDDLVPRPGIGQQGDKLRTLVLDLDGAGLEQTVRRQRRPAAHPKPDRRQRRRLDRDARRGKHRQGRGAIELQLVDAKVDRRRAEQGRQLGREGLAEAGLQRRRGPVGAFGGRRSGHVRIVDPMAGQGTDQPDLRLAERRRGIAVAVEPEAEPVHRAVFHQGQVGQHQRTGPAIAMAHPVQPPAEPRPAAQAGIGPLGDGRPVLRADVAAAAQECRDDVLGRPRRLEDRVEQLYRRGNARRWCHGNRKPSPGGKQTVRASGNEPYQAIIGVAFRCRWTDIFATMVRRRGVGARPTGVTRSARTASKRQPGLPTRMPGADQEDREAWGCH